MDITELVKFLSRILKFINTFGYFVPALQIKTFDTTVINLTLIVGSSLKEDGLLVHMTSGDSIELTAQGKEEFLNHFKEK